MREEYHVTLYSQMGPREGRLDPPIRGVLPSQDPWN